MTNVEAREAAIREEIVKVAPYLLELPNTLNDLVRRQAELDRLDPVILIRAAELENLVLKNSLLRKEILVKSGDWKG
jgi:hypothetical protein